jgi:hypothetical protein
MLVYLIPPAFVMYLVSNNNFIFLVTGKSMIFDKYQKYPEGPPNNWKDPNESSSVEAEESS